MLAPAVEPAAVAPDLLDDPSDAAVAARQESLDDAGLAVVITEADGAGEALVGANCIAQLRQPGVGLVGRQLADPLERRVRLGHEATDRDGAADVLAAAHLTAGLDDLLGEVGDLEDVLIGLGG